MRGAWGRLWSSSAWPEDLSVTITITLGEQRVFHAALAGTSSDNDDWALRKIRVVRRFDRSWQDVGETYAAADAVLFHTMFGLPPADDAAPTGGAVPVRVRGTLVGVLAISGLTSLPRSINQTVGSPGWESALSPRGQVWRRSSFTTGMTRLVFSW